ncbi:hypothetical protein RND71_018398 [Anisodus tanguticus]|uniref:Transmembrane protein n=1 Tax=Anisodus tanguticus TaxID=243964 RepID=A0AAE1VC24_9SOLA|nr:hypothetical protein RND71_018398 [Anisodus tanguticus]
MEKMSLNSQFYFLKKAMKILLPVSLFSLVFSQSYSLLPSLVHSFHEFSSYFSIQLFTYSSERNYIFLLCNGILVFIIKNSIGNISETKESHKEFKSREFKNQETKKEFLEKVVEIENQVEEELGTINKDDLVTVGTVDENEDEVYQESCVEIIEELEDEEELEETLEELHKKCDDFIKRIKKEINRKN